MLVPAMNSEEIIREIMLDYASVDRKSLYLSQNLRRKVVKSKNNTFCDITDYKSLRKNDWVILVVCNRKGQCRITVVHYLNQFGFNVVNVYARDKIQHFSGHFLERYNERYLMQNDLTKLDLIKNFVSHNIMIVHEVIDPADLKIRRIIGRFKQGVGLGTVEYINGIHVIDYKTFISNEMLYENQKDEVKTMEEYYHSFLDKDHIFKRIASY